MKIANMLALLSVLVILVSVSAPPATAQTWERPFASNSIWNTHIGDNPRYVACNMGALGAMCNDRMTLYRGNSSDPFRSVFQPEGWEKPGVNLPDNYLIPEEPNGCAAFLLPDGVTLRDYNALRRPNPATNPVGYYYGDSSLSGDGIVGGQAGSGMSSLGGTIRIGELESGSAIPHALKLELDWAVLYRNTGSGFNRQETFRWPANRSDGNSGGNSGDGPGYGGSNPSLRMGSLVALPRSVDINSLGLSARGLKIAQAMQEYGAYIVDSTGAFWQWGNGSYTASIGMEKGASAGYLRPDNGYYNNDQLYSDMDKIYQRLAVVDDNGPTSIGGGTNGGGASTTPIGQTIALRAQTNNKYVSADLSQGDFNPVRAGFATSVAGWERFRVDDAGSGKVALFSLNNSRYVSVDNTRDDKGLRAAWATGIGDWEKFSWETQSGNTIAMRSNVTGKYVSANTSVNGNLMASFATSIGGWEQFEWQPQCLTGEYYDNADFTGPFYVRRDAAVNFDWGTNSPMPGKIAPTTFSVRWTGQVVPRYTQPYTFFVNADDGVRLWVNGVQIVNSWTDTSSERRSSTVSLTANQKYAIKLEYYNNAGNARCQLSWQSASQPKQIVPDVQTRPF